ncbi:acyl-CoA dehydrogenase family protein [Hyphomicrobium sp.]|uniref:acyl-CoA dehydrogenase family protein n=1 Tax=Hyphomicrobium sp. TaxID=82 RepID=UPI001D84E90F|nr:acyl-CoA dehydrogenase family protein [Hyphomicrobium sp.]MBY0558800.1 acyl-CoA/acyl-ACP dehydrogenase [Hyphomicrobium sp.]
MNFQLTEEQRLLVDATRRLTLETLEPILKRHAPDRSLPKQAMLEIYAALAEFGVTSMRLPADRGGAGMAALDFGLMLEQLPPVVAISLISHDGSTVRLSAGASEAVCARYLPDLTAGRKIACTATSEGGSGSDSNAISTRLTVRGERAIISGQKLWITNGSICDVMVVACTTGADDRGRPLNRRVIVDLHEAKNVTIREIPITGLRQGHLSEVFFDDVEVPVENIVGEPGDAGKYMTLMWNGNRPLLGLICAGIASRAYQIARDHCANRKQFGRPLASMQLVQQDLSDIETAVTASRLMCLSALDALDHGLRGNGTSAMAKRFATSQSLRAVDLSMQLMGALGTCEEVGLEQMWRDTRVFQVPDGTNGILALIHGREITSTAAFR